MKGKVKQYSAKDLHEDARKFVLSLTKDVKNKDIRVNHARAEFTIETFV